MKNRANLLLRSNHVDKSAQPNLTFEQKKARKIMASGMLLYLSCAELGISPSDVMKVWEYI